MDRKIKLVKETTPLQKLNYKVGSSSIYMKRDDLIGFGGGGNKVRLFEYIAADIIRSKTEKIITFGSIHSNHVRVAATIASYLNMQCDIIILHDDDLKYKNNQVSWIAPNLKLLKYCSGIHIESCLTNDAHDFIDEYLDSQNKKGICYYWIPGGGHMSIAVQ